jgi:hypothetical protein
MRLSRLKRPKALWWRMAHPGGEPSKIRRRIQPRSEELELRMVIYRHERVVFLAEHPICQLAGCRRASTDLHHTRGRLGPLLLLKRFWRAVCRKHHNWIGDHPQEARAIGMLCQPGEWNTVPNTERNERN